MPSGLVIPQMLGQAGSDMFNAGMTDHQNKKQRKWSEQMYQRQYDDNVRFWQMQNEYNTPAAQMERFKAAGLNPNLIYGQGSGGNAGAVQTPDVQPYSYRAPQISPFDALGMLNAVADLDIKGAQADNLRSQNTVIQQDALLRMAQIAATEAGTNRSIFDLGFESELRATSADYRREQLRQLRTGTDLNIRRDVREALSNEMYLKEAAERVLNSRQQRAQSRDEQRRIRATIDNLKSDTSLKEADLRLRENGIYPGDPWYFRIGAQAIEDYLNKGASTTSGRVLKHILDYFK